MPINFEEEKSSGKIDFEEEGPQRLAPTMTESALRGAAQGASFGFADEIEGALRAGKDFLGDTKLGEVPDAYRKRRDQARADYEVARETNPTSYTGGEVAGGVGSAFVPGLGWANAAKTGLAAKAALGAGVGAVQGLGTSNADLTKGDVGNALEDTATGAAVGGATAGLLDRIGAGLRQVTPTNVARKLSNVFLNTPEELTDTYIKNPQGVLNAPRRHELADEYSGLLDKLKNETIEGSEASRKILRNEGKTIGGDEIQDIFGKKADELKTRSEGVWDDPQREAAYKWLQSTKSKYGPDIPEGVSQDLAQYSEQHSLDDLLGESKRNLSTNRIKDLLQSIDRSVDYEVAPGKFGRIDDNVKKDVRSQIDELLKGQSPAYAEQMKGVASDTALLKNASDLGSSPERLANVFRRVNTDTYGGGQAPREVLEQFGQRMGTDLLDKSKLALARESFDKSVTNGSRNVQMFSNWLKDVPVAKYAAPLIGGTVDKYGRKLTMGAVDAAAKLEQTLQSEGVQKFMQDVAPLVEAAKQGNPSAILTFQLLSQSNPDALRHLDKGEPQQ